MADGDRAYIGGWLIVEDTRFAWNEGMTDHGMKVAVCGEIGHVRHLLFWIAWEESVRRDLDEALEAFAQQVGVEYAPLQRRREASHNAHNGGNP